MTKPRLNMGDLYGERAVQAPFVAIACRQPEVGGFRRTLIGGILLEEMCTSDGWERCRGSMIIIPSRVEVETKLSGHRFESMVLSYLNMPDDSDSDNPVWRETWNVNGKRK